VNAIPNLAYPRVPGHEIIGRIDAVGPNVTTRSVGQRVGVGICGGWDDTCLSCRRGDFVNCANAVLTGIMIDGEIARTPGVDVVIVGTGDMSNFSGYPPGSPRYEQYLTDIRDAVKKPGKFFGTADAQYRSGHRLSPDVKFTQHGPPNDVRQPPPGGGK
jgi:hypothetical protein